MFRPDFKSTVPIYEQIIACCKEYVLKGWLKPGEPMPSVRGLAQMMDVNPNTVSKAYRELERQHIIVTVRGRGTFVEENPCLDVRVNEFENRLKPIAAEMLLSGMSEGEITDCVKSVLKALKTEEGE